MSYTGFGSAAGEVARYSEAVKRSVSAGGREAHLKAARDTVAAQANQALEAFAQSKAGQIVRDIDSVAYNVAQAVAQVRNGKMDAAGIASVTASGFAAFESVAAIMNTAGISGAGEVIKWAKTGAACAVGMSVPVWGQLGCGLSILSNLLDYLIGEPERAETWTTPRTLFRPNENSVQLIAADASRLASLLRFHYGVQSYAQLYNRLLQREHYVWLCHYFDWGNGTYPKAPLRSAGGKVVARDEKPVPGHNLRTIVQLMSLGMTGEQADRNGQDAFAAIAGWRHGSFDPSGLGLYKRFVWDQDVNQHAVGTAAYWCRMALAATEGKTHEVQVRLKPVGDTFGWPGWPPLGVKTYYADRVIDPRPFVFVDELLNFFGGVTARELAVSGHDAAKALTDLYGLGSYNPTQHLYVGDHGNRSAQSRDEPSHGAICPTNLQRAADNCAYQNLLLSHAKHNAFLRDVGAIRLTAAFSFLHNSYLWSSLSNAGRRDPIAAVKVGTSPVENTVLSPVDPRSIYVQRPSEAQATAGRRQGALSRSATTVAVSGVTIANSDKFDPNLGYAPSTISPTFLAAKVAQEQSILSAGKIQLSPAQFRELQQNVYERMTGTTIGRLTAPVKALRLAESTTSTSAGGVVLAGAAALLALKFLR